MFEGDNGGATTKGVTATEIRIAWPITASLADSWKDGAIALFEYLNQHFEFYGRKMVPVVVPVPTTNDVAGMRAEATNVAAQNVFGAVDNPQWFLSPAYFQELARQGVVSVMQGMMQLTADRDVFDPAHPYIWSVYPSVEQIWANLADLACTSLAGHPARHAGPSLVNQTRKFGIVATGNSRAPWIRPLVDALTACDQAPVVASLPGQTGTLWTQAATTAAQQFRSSGVTTIICACSDGRSRSVTQAFGVTAGWTEPEWLMPFFYTPVEQEWPLQSDPSRAHFFGLQPHPKLLPVQAEPWFKAWLEMRPQTAPQASAYWVADTYHKLLVLAAGIQSAGPNLTAETFAAGLMAADFPNDETNRAPDWMPTVGFGPGDHSFYDDYALAWWSDQAPSMITSPPLTGSWCYIGGGTRYHAGNWPADVDLRFFNPNEPCR